MPQFSDGNEWSETQFLNLEEGWNTISFFVDISFSSIKNMMESDPSYPVKEIRSQTETFRAFNIFNTMETIELSKGYQVYSDQTFLWVLDGYERIYSIFF